MTNPPWPPPRCEEGEGFWTIRFNENMGSFSFKIVYWNRLLSYTLPNIDPERKYMKKWINSVKKAFNKKTN